LIDELHGWQPLCDSFPTTPILSPFPPFWLPPSYFLDVQLCGAADSLVISTVSLMLNHQFDLQAGESILLGNLKVTLLEIEDDAAILEIEGPDGEISIQPINICSSQAELELAGV
jgi:hypothetical protein